MHHLATIGAVMISSGYEYFGSSLFSSFRHSAFASLTALYSAGAVLTLMSPVSRFVRNDVLTSAPFSYVTPTPHGIAEEEEEEEELNSVSVGANRKNLIPFSLYQFRISARMLNGGLSTTTDSGLYLYFW